MEPLINFTNRFLVDVLAVSVVLVVSSPTLYVLPPCVYSYATATMLSDDTLLFNDMYPNSELRVYSDSRSSLALLSISYSFAEV